MSRHVAYWGSAGVSPAIWSGHMQGCAILGSAESLDREGIHVSRFSFSQSKAGSRPSKARNSRAYGLTLLLSRSTVVPASRLLFAACAEWLLKHRGATHVAAGAC